jgi:hypothetical protein
MKKSTQRHEFLWLTKYIAYSIKECVTPFYINKNFLGILVQPALKKGKVTHYRPGVGTGIALLFHDHGT